MIVRKIRDSEIRRADEVFHLSFGFAMQDERTNEERRRALQETPCGRFDRYFMERWAAFEDDDATMMSVLTATPYPVFFDGQVVPMRGIGGVSTLPAYRRRGAMRACFTGVLQQMREEGTLFSYLYPFSTAYYAQFGYGLGCEQMDIRLPVPDRLPFPEISGRAVLLERGEHLAEFRAVYNAFAAGYNMMVAREDMDYEPLGCSRPEKDCQYIYVWINDQGLPKGAMTIVQKGRELLCDPFFFTDLQGFCGLLNLTYAFQAYADYLCFPLPLDRTITSLIPEWELSGARREKRFRGMVRVIDVCKVLELARYRGEGEAVIAVEDPILAENTGAYRVVYRQGRAEQVARTQDAPDISLTVGDFSRLIVGTAAMEELCFAGRLPEEAAASPALQGIFYSKPHFIANYF